MNKVIINGVSFVLEAKKIDKQEELYFSIVHQEKEAIRKAEAEIRQLIKWGQVAKALAVLCAPYDGGRRYIGLLESECCEDNYAVLLYKNYRITRSSLSYGYLQVEGYSDILKKYELLMICNSISEALEFIRAMVDDINSVNIKATFNPPDDD